MKRDQTYFQNLYQDMQNKERKNISLRGWGTGAASFLGFLWRFSVASVKVAARVMLFFFSMFERITRS